MDPVAALQFGNLAADVVRSISALDHGNLQQYQDSLGRAYHGLALLRRSESRSAYEEGLLMIRGLLHAKSRGTLTQFKKNLNKIVPALV
ncbi:hypothetical protein A3D66_02905 [Candidatus Kaiserbacteria bacterium RIFCSPHIGHO2_02_FULL_50_9]|uniref:Uncharacterized protein n=1 Tax=Candidatus Kaiserbacteria bacterium RIFCSPLOWO2_01_FULL_51_21 TaxID=1798508 RepID=A0A1F6ECI6_9BACT|nr:MAG: hypothetical protein A3D66_02905 [Candidatus Kaiserbacteria bacterium RIFCSPHIGHO2_02_FULL_50_9]OGG71393.1 MAG: hypothetical protein A3A35_01440 [Candidatus Kaiserbacteria bacterium RIFCSPLOWO2_01_FULL_51_21]